MNGYARPNTLAQKVSVACDLSCGPVIDEFPAYNCVGMRLRTGIRTDIRLRLSWVCLLLPSISVLTAQAPVPADVVAGQTRYQKLCTACHGGNAKGGRGPDLTSGL